MQDLKLLFCQPRQTAPMECMRPHHWLGCPFGRQSFAMNKHAPFFSNKLEK